YVGGGNGPAWPSTIYSVPLANPTSRARVATVPVFIDTLLFDPDTSTILAGGRSNSPANGAIFRIDPATGAFTILLPNWQNAPSIALEPATGDLLFAGERLPGNSGAGLWHLPAGSTAPVFLSNTYGSPPRRPGAPAALTVVPDPRVYSGPTVTQPGMTPVGWNRGVLPGGLPLVGNQGFALQLDLPATSQLLLGSVVVSG